MVPTIAPQVTKLIILEFAIDYILFTVNLNGNCRL